MSKGTNRPHYTAHIEILTMIVRGFGVASDDQEVPGGVYGDDYTWSAAVKTHGPDTIELLGVDKPINTEPMRALHRAFYKLGFRWHVVRKFHNGIQTLSPPRRIRP
jgi:hypothetical protein